MLTPQVEVQLRILFIKIHHAVEEHRYMRIIDEELSAVPVGGIGTVQMQVAVGIIFVRQFPYMPFDITTYHTVVNPTGRLHIDRDRSQRRMIDHSSQLEPTSFHLRIVGHVFQD